MSQKSVVTVEYFSDLLCVWAYVAQARVDELEQKFGPEVQVRLRYCDVFGDTAHKIGAGWADRGGYAGFGAHVAEVAGRFGHVTTHPDIWHRVRPASSAGAHLLLKAVQLDEAERGGPAGGGHDSAAARLAWGLRLAFFQDGRDIGDHAVARAVATELAIPLDGAEAAIADGRAFAALAADARDQARHRLEGSPSFVLNDGRQKLYGNVGYRVLEANIRELLRTPAAGEASWC